LEGQGNGRKDTNACKNNTTKTQKMRKLKIQGEKQRKKIWRWNTEARYNLPIERKQAFLLLLAKPISAVSFAAKFGGDLSSYHPIETLSSKQYQLLSLCILIPFVLLFLLFFCYCFLRFCSWTMKIQIWAKPSKERRKEERRALLFV
jgi:hypothetical protein